MWREETPRSMMKQGDGDRWRPGAILTMHHTRYHWTNHSSDRDASLEALPTYFLSLDVFSLCTWTLHFTQLPKAILNPLLLWGPFRSQSLCPVFPGFSLERNWDYSTCKSNANSRQVCSAPIWTSDKCLWNKQLKEWEKRNKKST